MARINFKKASRVDEKKAEKFFYEGNEGSEGNETDKAGNGGGTAQTRAAAPRPVGQKKTRVFCDLAPDELQKLDRLVMERQMAGGRVVYRSVVARELLLEALESAFRGSDAE